MRNKIFISYRRSDSMSTTSRIYERLIKRYGKAVVFKDLDSINLAAQFRQVIDQAVPQSAVLLVVIGRGWLDATDEQGNRRLDQPEDLVRKEIEAALRLNTPLLPIQIEGAELPTWEQLPPSLQPLLDFNGLEVPNEPYFDAGMRRLLTHVDAYLPKGMRPAVRMRRAVMAGLAAVLVLSLLSVLALHILHRPSGTARTSGGTLSQTTVATHTAMPTGVESVPTPTRTLSPTIIYQNSLTAPASEWEPDQYCFFASDGFHVAPNLACQSPVRGRSDVDVSVQMKQVSGAPTDLNGIEVRRSGNPASLYEFDIDANGEWQFEKCIRSFNNCDVLGSGSNPAIRTGLGATNAVEVRAVGSQFTLLVNGTEVGQADDATLASGDVWLDTGGSAECVFTNFTATLPT